MNRLRPINLDNGVTIIHPLRQSDILRHDQIVDNLIEILSDEENTRFISEKRTDDKERVSNELLGVTFRYDQQLGYTHFITLKNNNEVLGQINIITPKGIETETQYKIKDTWFIEYYLNKKVWNLGVMSGAIKAIVESMKDQGITKISALCMPENIGSIKILTKSGFKRTQKFDLKQDVYELQLG
ncbi:GNAT family N-acetyltransferase [Gelidibacter pelagius]|uniref:GNAT family N-acetyltransferase n=1 Tax=Gelidibacter pelagius TaxID=2819985 RepID=A0ABS3SPP7_9FLAO|nr:GNAT family protein [Gelidibacter pelagius]MBO3097682.1 GNAT family N-acetyltransferase [Gelidibacter pelagius]